MTGGFLYTLPSYPPRLRAEQASQDHSSPLISCGSTSSSNSSGRGTRGCRGGGSRRPDAVVMETLERSASQAQPAQRAQQAQRVDPLEALPLRMALSNDALLDAYAAVPSSQGVTDVHVGRICCSALPVGSIQHAVSMMALTSQHGAQIGPATSSKHDDAQQGLSHPSFSSAQALRTEYLIEFGSLREPSFSEVMPPVGSLQHTVSKLGLSNPLLQPSITSAPSWGATSARAGDASVDTPLGTIYTPAAAVQLPARLAASCPDRSMHSSRGEPVILQQRSSGGSASGQLPAHSSSMAGTDCPAGFHSLGEPSFSALMLAAFDAFQSEEADMPDVPDNFVGVPDIEAAPLPALLTSGGWPQSSHREVDGQVSSGLHLHMMSPSGEIAMQQAVDSGGSRKAGDPSARACSQSADVSSAGRTEGRPVRRVGSAPEATSRSRRLRRRGNRRILDTESDSEGAKTGALGRVERNRVIQREYLVRKRARQEAVHAQTAQLAADVEQLRAEVAALCKRSNSLERILARPSNEAGSPHAAGADISMTASDAPDSRYSPMAWRTFLETMALSPAQREALTSLGARSDHHMACLRARREQAAFALLQPPPAPLSGYAVSRMHQEAEHLLGCLQETVELEQSWETTFDAIARRVLSGSQQGMLQQAL